MFGIPSTDLDYTIDPEIYVFDSEDSDFDPEATDEKNIYRLRKEIVAAHRKAGFPNSAAEQVATRNVLLVLEIAKNGLDEEAEEEQIEDVEE